MEKYIKVEFPDSQYFMDYDMSDGCYDCVATDYENDECIPVVFVTEELYDKVMKHAESD